MLADWLTLKPVLSEQTMPVDHAMIALNAKADAWLMTMMTSLYEREQGKAENANLQMQRSVVLQKFVRAGLPAACALIEKHTSLSQL